MSKTVPIHDNIFDVLFDVIFYVILYHVFDDFFHVVFDMVFEVKFFNRVITDTNFEMNKMNLVYFELISNPIDFNVFVSSL